MMRTRKEEERERTAHADKLFGAAILFFSFDNYRGGGGSELRGMRASLVVAPTLKPLKVKWKLPLNL